MRIGVMALAFPPARIGGAEICARNIATHLARRGHEVHVIASGSRGLKSEYYDHGCIVHRVPTVRKPVLFGLTYYFMARPVLSRVKPDIILCHLVSVGVGGYMAKKLLQTPYVVLGQGSDVYLPWPFKRILLKFALNRADAVIALTDHMRLAIQQYCSREVVIIPNGVEIARFQNLPTRGAARRQVGFAEDEKLILFVGRLSAVKGLRYLVEAFQRIHQRNPLLRLGLVGEGDERPYLENLVGQRGLESRVTFVGEVPHDKIPEYMAAADVFALPSLSEGFPLVLLEAMAAGLPIVATNVRGMPEILKNGENGFLVEPRDPADLSHKLELLLGNEDLCAEISRKNREKAKEYSWEQVAAAHEQLYWLILHSSTCAV